MLATDKQCGCLNFFKVKLLLESFHLALIILIISDNVFILLLFFIVLPVELITERMEFLIPVFFC